MIMHIKGIAAASGAGIKKFRETADAAAPCIIAPTTAAHGYFAPLHMDQRPAIHNICSAVHFNVDSMFTVI